MTAAISEPCRRCGIRRVTKPGRSDYCVACRNIPTPTRPELVECVACGHMADPDTPCPSCADLRLRRERFPSYAQLRGERRTRPPAHTPSWAIDTPEVCERRREQLVAAFDEGGA